MGGRKLWEILQPASESRSILNLSTIHGFRANNRGLRTFVLGDDISIRINSVSAALQTAGVPRLTNTAWQTLLLEKIFYQLCKLSLAPVTAVFIFDGPGRPSIKRGTRVITRTPWLNEHLKAMITHFGFYFYDAPGEAEAELAHLNAEGKLDGILTEDSDAFLFGARLVIRTLGPSVQHHSTLYSMDSIENTEAVCLDREGLILCVLFLGGDYDDGVQGVGPAVAHALALLGFGRDLINIVDGSVGLERNRQLFAWRDALRNELRTNSQGRLGHCWPSLADNIPDAFPSLDVIKLYTKPLTSASHHYTGCKPDPACWTPQQPDISSMATFCCQRFGWKGEDLLKKFNANLWPAAAFRLISSPLVHYAPKDKLFTVYYAPNDELTSVCQSQAALLKKTEREKCNAAFPDSSALNIQRVRASTDNFVSSARLTAFQAVPSSEIKLISLPEVILARAMRETPSRTPSLACAPQNCDVPLTAAHAELNEGANSDSDHSFEHGGHSGVAGRDQRDNNVVEILDPDEEDFLKAHGKLATEGIIDLTETLVE